MIFCGADESMEALDSFLPGDPVKNTFESFSEFSLIAGNSDARIFEVMLARGLDSLGKFDRRFETVSLSKDVLLFDSVRVDILWLLSGELSSFLNLLWAETWWHMSRDENLSS